MASNDETQIANAVKAYYAEYQKYPVAPSNTHGPVVFSTDNNLLLNVLRDRTGAKSGNALNPRDVVYLDLPLAKDQDHPASGLQSSTGILFDPWGTPYHIAIDASGEGELNGKFPIPGFYSDVGPIKAGVIAWSYGKNGELGGGPATKPGFSNEPGTPGKFGGSGDVGLLVGSCAIAWATRMDRPFDFTQSRFVSWIVVGLGILVFIAVLIGLFEPLNGARTMAYKSTALHDEKLILAAIKAYEAEYHTLPLAPDASGVVVFSKDNNVLFDVLRNRTGIRSGNSLNPRGFAILQVPPAPDQDHPRGGIQTSTGIWFDPWGTPYHIAINAGKDGGLNGENKIPDFYSDVGPLKNLDVIVWSYGENRRLGGDASVKLGILDKPGAPGEIVRLG